MDLFVQILVLQLLTVNYFKPNYDLNKLPTLLGGKNIVSIYGRQAYNPFYHKKALFNINEEVLKKLNLEHDRLKITRKCLYSEAFKKNMPICSGERWFSAHRQRYLTGFKLYLGVNYFDGGLQPLKSYKEKCDKLNIDRE